jgi:hypothetical protein
MADVIDSAQLRKVGVFFLTAPSFAKVGAFLGLFLS